MENLRKQRQEQVDQQQENKRSFHVHTVLPQDPNPIKLVPRSDNYEVAELRWENGQLGMHGLSGLPHSKSTWGGTSSETLESIVNQATGRSSVEGLVKIKGSRSESNQCATSFNGSNSRDGRMELISGSGSESGAFCRGSEDSSTMDISWASFESTPSFKPKTTLEDSANSHHGSENQNEDGETITETARSHSSRRSRAAAVHNLSERRRRDRINQKMKALQKLVPNASKTDKASMLDEVIEYLKQLQAQVQAMSYLRNNMPQMMMSLGMQQQQHQHQQHQLQMSLLARMGMGVGLGMGMGMGMGMLDINTVPHTNPRSLPPLIHPAPVASSAASAPTPTFVPSPFLIPSMISHAPRAPNQPMNMELYNKMAALYQQQVNQGTQATSNVNQVQTDS